MLLDECDSRVFRILNTSIYECFHLVHEDWILKNTGSLSLHSRNQCVEVHSKVLARVCQSKEARPIHTRLTMHVHTPISIAQIRLQCLLKLRIPIQNIHTDTVNRIEHCVPRWMTIPPPGWTCTVTCTVNHVCDVVSVGK